MIPIRASLIAVALLVPGIGVADTLRAGTKIDTAAADMRLKGYKETVLQMAPIKATEELKFWQVDDGVLIATYSKPTRQITKIDYWISDHGPRSERYEVNLTVIEFNPDSGIMTIQTKKKTAEGGTEQPTTATESKPDGKEKPEPESEGRSQ